LPALSVAVTVNRCLPRVWVSMRLPFRVVPTHEATPETLSEQAYAACTRAPRWYLAFFGRVSFTTGFDQSSRTRYVACPRLPARSWQSAVATLTPWSVTVVVGVQLSGSTPDSASDQFQVTMALPRTQPFAFGAGDSVGVAAGATSSVYWTWTAPSPAFAPSV